MPERDLFRRWAGVECEQYSVLGANGSNRRYVRMSAGEKRCIAALNDDVRENGAFFYFSREMSARGIRVPQLYAVSDDRRCYLQEDLGDTTLYNHLYAKRQRGEGTDAEAIELYKRVLTDLAEMQTRCRDLDFSQAYPRSDFDRQSLQWDFNYFKYFFLKLLYIPFDEQLLEDDFQTLIGYLLQGDCGSFMYRDFQTRNIMLVSDDSNSQAFKQAGNLYYIDYQGARRGAPQYDVASLLYSSKAELSEAVRQELLNHYVAQYFAAATLGHSNGQAFKHSSSQAVQQSDIQAFKHRFYGYVLARMMQAMGAYGYRGLFERKDYFLASIPLAVANLRTVVESHWPDVELPHLKKVFEAIADSQLAANGTASKSGERLTVTVTSFSYKKGLPSDPSGNGGGFVFDCRALPNPGRYPEYRNVTGRDAPVIAFLEKEEAVKRFLENACALVSQSVAKYTERRFTSLMVSFGCTGGQHRSVYCAEQMAAYLRRKFDCDVQLRHREQD